MQLSACAMAITSPRPPSSVCCAKLREQRPCLCKYLKNPSLQKFIKSEGAKRVARSCRANYPKC
ncbi:probable non-specific lipid-transfer protein akcs9 [Phtheirospermum japonicum]|uniref:Probable non-specific lipid-transfer protein akcs9 n=1 Tax=Phtheirospermum japonicum TaxID=374723 RepID=A0A830D6E6_9LAMI|nr:probable non-specific lipid-transfer protein akcs9 [Phtheirospermum japonicum]